MKTTLIALILLFLINTPASDYTYGVKIGGTYSTADVYNNLEIGIYEFTDNDYYWGTFFSFYGYRNLYKMMDLQLELNYNQRGVTYGNDDINTRYATIPSLELVSLLKLNISYIILYVGAFSSLTLIDKYTTSSSSSTGGGTLTLDYGCTLGLEFKYKKYLIDFRYNQGFDDFIEHENSNAETRYYDNSRQFVLSFGYEF